MALERVERLKMRFGIDIIAAELTSHDEGLSSVGCTSGRKTPSTISLMASSDKRSNVIRISWRARSVGSDTIRGVRRAAAISPRSMARPRMVCMTSGSPIRVLRFALRSAKFEWLSARSFCMSQNDPTDAFAAYERITRPFVEANQALAIEGNGYILWPRTPQEVEARNQILARLAAGGRDGMRNEHTGKSTACCAFPITTNGFVKKIGSEVEIAAAKRRLASSAQRISRLNDIGSPA